MWRITLDHRGMTAQILYKCGEIVHAGPRPAAISLTQGAIRLSEGLASSLVVGAKRQTRPTK